MADAAAITIAATVGTAPLMAIHFEQVSLAALPANLLAAPAIAPVMWLGILAAAAAQIAEPLAAPFSALTAPLLVYLQWVAQHHGGDARVGGRDPRLAGDDRDRLGRPGGRHRRRAAPLEPRAARAGPRSAGGYRLGRTRAARTRRAARS